MRVWGPLLLLKARTVPWGLVCLGGYLAVNADGLLALGTMHVYRADRRQGDRAIAQTSERMGMAV